MPTIGDHGDALSGPESRALRASLNLERRHIAVLVTAAQLWAKRPAATSDVAMWERSSRGYPQELVHDLQTLDVAVGRLSADLAEEAERDTAAEVATLRRPRGPKRVHQLLRLHEIGVDWGPEVVGSLDADGGDFWDRLADAAITRAALQINVDDWVTRVVLDRED